MNKKTGAIFLIAGTCIGSGMLAIPMALSGIGIVPGTILMLCVWAVMYYSSLITIELNMEAGQGIPLGEQARRFSGKLAGIIADLGNNLLAYALIAVFIYAGSSVIGRLFESHGVSVCGKAISFIYSLIISIFLLFPIKFVDLINRVLFLGLVSAFSVLMVCLICMVDFNDIPLVIASTNGGLDFSAIHIAIPVIFTSFGYKLVAHSATNYCDCEPATVRKAFFWGSLIPAFVYIVWNFGVLSVIYYRDLSFYCEMGSVDVGTLVVHLSQMAKWPYLQVVVLWVSFFAIVTSIVGVGLGMCDTIKGMVSKLGIAISSCLVPFIAIFPACFVAIMVPNAFLAILGFAGMILVSMDIFMPVYLFYKAGIRKTCYKGISFTVISIGISIAGVFAIICEILNMIK